MREFRVIASRRSGHHAVIDWIRRTATGRSEHLNDLGVGPGGIERVSRARSQDLDLLVYNYESKLIAEIEQQGKELEIGVGEKKDLVTIVVLRDFHNNFASLLHCEPPQNKPDRWYHQLIARMGEYLDYYEENGNAVLIHFDQWNSDLGYRNQIAEQLGLSPEESINYDVAWVGSSFGERKLNSKDLNSRWRWMCSSRRLHALSRNSAVVGLQARLRPVSGELKLWLEGQFRSSVDVYVLTYGAPDQLWEFLNSLRLNAPEFLSEANVIVINQTPKESPSEEKYQAVVDEYSVEQFYLENRGTSGGRFEILNRFAKNSSADIAFIFEDDHIANGAEKEPCRAGFQSYVLALFRRCVDMVRRYDLDYLKLCFSELYDDHSSRRSNVGGKAQYEVRVHHGLSCMVGEAYYSNWPIAIQRSSIEKIVDLDHPEDEGTIATKCFPKIKSGEVKAATLCATPFRHERVQDYELPREEI